MKIFFRCGEYTVTNSHLESTNREMPSVNFLVFHNRVKRYHLSEQYAKYFLLISRYKKDQEKLVTTIVSTG